VRVRYRFVDGHEFLLTSQCSTRAKNLIPWSPHGLLISRLFEPDLTEQEWLRTMYRWRPARWSYRQIAAELNRLNVPTKTGAGNVITYKGAKRLSYGRWQCGGFHRV
jgi:hypothetical protein